MSTSEPKEASGSATPPASTHSAHRSKERALMKSARPALYLLSWTVASSACIVMNKFILVDDGFSFPLALTGAGQTASFLMGVLTIRLGHDAVRPAPSPKVYISYLLPVVFCSAGTLFFGNLAYLHLSVSFIQILKAATPAFTLTICLLAGLERPTLPLAVSVLLIVVGTGVATLIESGSIGFSWLGFLYFTASAFLEAVRVVYIQLLLNSLKYTATEVLLYLGPPTAAVLFGASAIFESRGILQRGVQLIRNRPVMYFSTIFMGFLVNITTAGAIQETSGLTFKVFGCVKNTFVVLCGMLLGDRINALQLLGNAISMAGFILFSRSKLQANKQKQKSL